MADRPVRRGAPASPGQADQLPKGEAQAVNTRNAATRQAGQPAPTPQGVDLSGRQQQQTLPPLQGDHELLFSPTDRPDEPISRGFAPNLPSPPPPNLMDWLPLLRDAANMPGASEQLKQLYMAYADLASRLPQG